MTDHRYRSIAVQGLWKNNPALVQLLGLCPLLGVSNSIANAIGLGIATTLVAMGSNMAVSLIRHYVAPEIRLPVFVMIIAAFTSSVELLMQAYTYDLYQILGIFIPLIVTNCIILGRADGFASKNPVLPSIFDGLMMGGGFFVVLLLLGALRELIGQGTLFANMDLLFGSAARNWTLIVIPDYKRFLFAILPPGAFVFMGCIIAVKNVIDRRQKEKNLTAQVPSGERRNRIRVTG
ncbi:Electron transport complex subunit RnfE [invertebrate metagenome]|uniref:Electron transport complex subunit RnfE n=1 Tax=invertebrate metagenome TaxID=1711999 RepID=A0A2H9TAL8_9ZZZZ